MGAMFGFPLFPREREAGRFMLERAWESTRRKAFGLMRRYRSHRRYRSTPRHEGSNVQDVASSRIGDRRGGAFEAQKNVRGGTEFLTTTARPARKARWVGGIRKAQLRSSEEASRQVHQSWRQRIAAPRLGRDDSISANCIGSRALHPAPLMHETARTHDRSCGPHLRI